MLAIARSFAFVTAVTVGVFALLSSAKADHMAGDVLALNGDDQNANVDCTARNVLIRGDSGTFVLRGGCASLTIEGDSNKVKAQVQPGSKITVRGDSVRVVYTLSSPGKDPAIKVQGDDSTVKKGE